MTDVFTIFTPTRTTLAKACSNIRMHILTKHDGRGYLRNERGEQVTFDAKAPAPVCEPGHENDSVDMVLTMKPGEAPKPTEKQQTYIKVLLDKATERYTPSAYHRASEAAYKAGVTALLLQWPEPRTMQEASIMIDALQGDVREYARWRPVWAQPIIDKMAARLGEHGEQCRTMAEDGLLFTAGTWRQYIASLLQ